MRLFVETSALLKRYLEEVGADAIDDMVALVDQHGGDLFTSVLVAIEVVSCFAKMLRQEMIDREEYDRLTGLFEVDYHDLFIVVQQVDHRAEPAFQRAVAEPYLGISAAARLHVEAALHARDFQRAQPLGFVTSHARLRAYAHARGLPVWDPAREGLEALLQLRVPRIVR